MSIPKGLNWQAGTGDPPADIPLLVIVDAGQAPARDGWMYRLMDANDMGKLPRGAIVQLWNEAQAGEMPDRQTCLALVDRAHQLGLQVVYGGDQVGTTGWSVAPDAAVLFACDFYGLHASVWGQMAPATYMAKPVIVTELEQPPHGDAWPAIMAYLAACPVPCFYFAWRWRNNASQGLDLADQPTIAAQVAAINLGNPGNLGNQGGASMPQLVPGGAIEKYVQANNLTPLTDEFEEHGDQVARADTDKGVVRWYKADGQVRFLPFA